MNLRYGLLLVVLAVSAPVFAAETFARAQYADPVDHYGHFALGRPHEYARLTVVSDNGRIRTYRLPESEVFEDLAPRIVRLAAGEPDEILAIVSSRSAGSRLVLFRAAGDGLAISARSAAIGTPNRWLNPVGVADLDGDGHAEIAAVITPHIGGVLKAYRRSGGDLVEIAALEGFSNHVYGTAELALSMPVLVDGRMRLLVPDAARLNLRIIALVQHRLVETGRCKLTAPITGGMKQDSPGEVSVGSNAGRQALTLNGCGK